MFGQGCPDGLEESLAENKVALEGDSHEFNQSPFLFTYGSMIFSKSFSSSELSFFYKTGMTITVWNKLND